MAKEKKAREHTEDKAEVVEADGTLIKVGKNIIPRNIEDEMKESYIDYSMSVIVGRALPDVRDGLKPVHRRILYAMQGLGLQHTKPYRKSARVVGECFVKDTLVLSEDGLMPIQDIEKGEKVYTSNGLKKVTELYEMPEKPLLRVILENGVSNTVTKSQKFRVIQDDLSLGWKEAKDLNPGDQIVIKAAYPDIEGLVTLRHKGQKVRLTDGIAYMLGFLMSDGWVENYPKYAGRISFYSNERSVLERIQRVLQTDFQYQPTIEANRYIIKMKDGRTVSNCGYGIRINRKSINDLLVNSLGLKGIRAESKTIPPEILRSPRHTIMSFISGLVDGDGCVHKKRNVIHYGSVSIQLINRLQILLQQMGMFSHRYTAKAGGSSINGKEVIGRQMFHYLEFVGTSAFSLASQLDLAHPEKAKRLDRILESSLKKCGYEEIPFAARNIFPELSSAHLGSGWYQDLNGAKFRMGIKYPGGCKIRYSKDLSDLPLTKSQIEEWGLSKKLERIGSPLFKKINKILGNGLYFLKVSNIEKMPPGKTYDLQVEGDHEFIAHGMVSHNCLGKYHPHGDMAVYDSMVRMVQDFSLRYPLVDGQGNFGSVDGDPPAAQRYTEVRMAKIAEELLADIEKETVNFVPNFDDSEQEPTVLPSKFPNLLVNGSSGIAVGMATNMPPHNLAEVIDGVIASIDNPQITPQELMRHVKGPDFPTGGIICGQAGIIQAYLTGRGSIRIRAKAEVKEEKKRERIIVTEIPYQVNKASLIEAIADLVKDKRIEGISDIRDESDREGMRIVIEIKQGAQGDVVLNQLYKHTAMEATFGVINLALVDNKPVTLDLKGLIANFIDHRKEVITRRCKFELKKSEDRAHILEGLRIALDKIDAIVKLLRASKNAEEAKKGLMEQFTLSEKQALAILDMRLQKLTGLEREKIDQEYSELLKYIKWLKEVLADEKKVLQIIKDELAEIKQRYGDERRTAIQESSDDLEAEDLIAEENMVVSITNQGYIKRLPVGTYRAQNRGGRGVIGMETKEDDFVEQLFVASTHDYMLFFTDKGMVHWLKVYQLPVEGRYARGKAIVNLLNLEKDEKISSAIRIREFSEGHYLAMITKNGLIKKTELEAYSRPRKGGIIAINLRDDDELVTVLQTNGSDELIIATKSGMSIRFKETDARAVGRDSMGVIAVKLKSKDEVVGAVVVDQKSSLLTVTENGYGKRSSFDRYPLQNRAGQGVIDIKTTDRNGSVVAVKTVHESDEIMSITSKGIVTRVPVSAVSEIGRNTQGVRIMKLEEGNKVVSVARIISEDEEVKEEPKPEPKEPAKVETKKAEIPTESKKPLKEPDEVEAQKEIFPHEEENGSKDIPDYLMNYIRANPTSPKARRVAEKYGIDLSEL